MNTVQDHWVSYHTEIIPADAPTVQRLECKRAFYAGALAAFQLITGPFSDMPDDAAMDALSTMREELMSFGRAVGTPNEAKV